MVINQPETKPEAPARFGYTNLITYADDMVIEEPGSYSEAIESENCDKCD